MSTRASPPRPDVASTLRISELATAAGVGIPTLRFYERKKLLPAPRRTQSGYRVYEPRHVTRVRFIRRAQELGFSLREVGALLAMSDRRVPSNTEVERFASEKVQAIDKRVKDLQRMKRAILKLMAEGFCGTEVECPVIASLGDAPPAIRPARRARS
ncbi:heavy metal-responsive transcriptional regulator [Pyxidicoccus parkwayensis]|uniref:Heavy metal-responsive transcriptional regulator n=1 Tax=Pyxidicoccus parkwayensis TaxID=2813578 RepID=A0ABX7NMZ1_9BACT|nr:heavy metal-responsive transcriptional regulator [Pyxidicoccus parkwaysis]QSQ18892.1 heavy metal-responsive transcriptional regulator [Pyxidicoccus parkwaysis]